MKKFIVFSDAQFHPWQETTHPELWVRMTNVITKSFKLANKRKADVLFLGDLFESKRAVRSDISSVVYRKLATCLKKFPSTKFHFVAGNHDQYAGVFTQEALRLNENVVMHTGSSPSYIDEELGVVALPYGASVSATLPYRVLCSHVDIKGATMGSGVKAEESSVDDGLFRKAGRRELVLNGHYHVPQHMKNRRQVDIWCVGAPFQHNWNDARYSKIPRGLWELTVTEHRALFRRALILKSYPRFYMSESDKDYRPSIDFIRAETTVEDDTPIADNVCGTVEDLVKRYVYDRVDDEERRERLVAMGISIVQGDEQWLSG